MTFTPRLLAPVAAPPPPKPPQLNIVASALMPDVSTDTLGPGRAPALAAAGWATSVDHESGRVMWHRPPGDTLYRELVEHRNALIASLSAMDDDDYKRFEKRARQRLEAITAAVGVMSDVEMQQAEIAAGVTVDSLPTSIYPSGVARWTGGFQYAPENQYPGVIADACGWAVDLPALNPPTAVAGTPSTAAGTLPAATYTYKVTVLNANGESLPSAASANVVLSGTGQITVSWTAPAYAPAGVIAGYNVYRSVGAAWDLVGSTTGATTFLDHGQATGAAAPTADTTAGPGHYTNLPKVGYIPFLIYVEDECSTFGWSERDYTGRALRLLDNATPNAIEREFWSGAYAQNTLTGPLAGLNAFLMQSNTSANGGTGVVAKDLTPGTVPSLTRGVQILEDYLANTGFGGQGMIHVAPETSPNLLGARRIGSLLLSVMDNIIVPGSGYPTVDSAGNNLPSGPIGNANETPPAGQAWIYATDLVSVRLDEPRVFPATMAEAVDRGTGGEPDLVRFRAERFAAVTFDVARLAACRVNLAT